MEENDLVALDFSAGKNNVAEETNLPKGSVRQLLNVDLSNSGVISRRQGFTRIFDGSGSTVHSLFSSKLHTVFCHGTTLKKLNEDYSTVDILPGIDPNHYVSYTEVNNQIYFSNGVDNGIIAEDGTFSRWGVESPTGQPLLSLYAGGDLFEGTYQVAITFVDANGQESGAALAAKIDVPAGYGFTCSLFPNNEQATSINIYVSTANGVDLYLRGTVPVGTATVNIVTNPASHGRRLDTQFLDRVPAGHIVRYYKGRMWVAVDDLLIFTPAMRYGLYDPRYTYFRFPSRITIVQPVQDGIFVVADQTYFLAGMDPQQMEQRLVYDASAVEGTGASVPPSMIKEEELDQLPDNLAFWYSSRGAVLGFPGGHVNTITEDRLALPQFEKGATLLRSENSVRQIVTTLTNRGRGSSFGTSDYAVAEVRRSGVLRSDSHDIVVTEAIAYTDLVNASARIPANLTSVVTTSDEVIDEIGSYLLVWGAWRFPDGEVQTL